MTATTDTATVTTNSPNIVGYPCRFCGTPVNECSMVQNPDAGPGDCCPSCHHVKPEARHRSFIETGRPDGGRVFEYTSETHTIRIEVNAGIDSHNTVAVLGKLARWIEITPSVEVDPWGGRDTANHPF